MLARGLEEFGPEDTQEHKGVYGYPPYLSPYLINPSQIRGRKQRSVADKAPQVVGTQTKQEKGFKR